MTDPAFSFGYEQKGDEINFSDLAELKSYVQHYMSAYRLIDLSKFNTGRTLEQHAVSKLNQVMNLQKQISNLDSGAITPEDFSNHVRKAFNVVPPHSSVRGQLLLNIWETEGALEFAGALAACKGVGYQLNTGEHEYLRGVIRFFLEDFGVSPNAVDGVQRALAVTRNEYSEHLRADAERSKVQLDQSRRQNEEAEAAKNNIAYWWKQESQKLIDDTHKKLDAKIADFELTQKTYEESMRLLRPRRYWSVKAKGHEKRATWLGGIAFVWLLVAGLATICGVWWLFEQALLYSKPDENGYVAPSAAYFTLGAMGLTGSTVAFWIARLLVRLWLSEIHLGMDARERVTMIESYLALSRSGTVDEKQRELVLTAIFRPTQDGIVKDDAAADPTLIGLLNRLSKP